jgi:hypothetical protein
MSAADKAKLDSIDLATLVQSVSGTAPIVSSGGDNPDISITPATDVAAGSMSAADKAKLDALGPGGALDFAMFYGLTAGTGNESGTDYAATIPVRTANGTGNVPFPRTGPAAPSSGITALSSATFQLAVAGVYQVSFECHTTEPGQLELVVNNSQQPYACFANMNPTAGGHPIGGTVLVQTVNPNAVLEVVNPNGNSTALTITPADGADTNANSQTLTIIRIA